MELGCEGMGMRPHGGIPIGLRRATVMGRYCFLGAKDAAMSAQFASTSVPAGRVKPRISVNKLAEYLVSRSAARRREIIRDQFQPPAFKAPRYDTACDAIIRYFTRGGAVSEVNASLHRLVNWQPGPDSGSFAIQKNRNCRDALEAFLHFVENAGVGELTASGFTITAGPRDAPKLTKAGVAISVRPELIIRGTDTKKGPFVGAVKLHACKGFAMDQNAAEYVGTLLREYGELHLTDESPCDYRRCYVLDVFAKQLYPAPKATTKRQSEIVAACEEIANGWPAD